MLTPMIVNQRKELDALCRRFDVKTLEVFGSAATTHFDATTSDLDFIVSFANESFGALADRYLGFAEALEQLFQRPVDLLTERSLRNPYFIQEVNRTRQKVYEQPNSQAAL
ncbi:MAG: nucleotidyltransferase domain-containing protein [Caldilineaceae bacterium]|nr:nucleotidyltransferase domain-containing protein [Caldilineaceae bacterium]